MDTGLSRSELEALIEFNIETSELKGAKAAEWIRGLLQRATLDDMYAIIAYSGNRSVCLYLVPYLTFKAPAEYEGNPLASGVLKCAQVKVRPDAAYRMKFTPEEVEALEAANRRLCDAAAEEAGL